MLGGKNFKVETIADKGVDYLWNLVLIKEAESKLNHRVYCHGNLYNLKWYPVLRVVIEIYVRTIY